MTCMDPRIPPQQRIGSSDSDAFMLRNAGGRVTDDVIRGLLLCTRLMGVTDIGVLHHTDCRLQGLTNDELTLQTGVDVDFLPFLDSAATVPDDVNRLRTCGLFGDDVSIWGGLYCIDSHTMTVLVPPKSPMLPVTSRGDLARLVAGDDQDRMAAGDGRPLPCATTM